MFYKGVSLNLDKGLTGLSLGLGAIETESYPFS
jgi:hypothetical protein